MRGIINKIKLFKFLSLVLLFVGLGQVAFGQTTVFSDDFSTNTSATYTISGAIGASAWSVSRAGADWGARRNTSPAQLELTNDVGATGNVAGWAYASTALSSFSSPYNTTLSSNTGVVTWTFNMRTNRGSALSGFSATTTYGLAFILCATSTTAATAGNGYAVIMGGGTNNNMSLVRYTGGLQGTITSIIAFAGTPTSLTDYMSVKVTYNPSTNGWELFNRDDGSTAFADPASGSLTSLGTATNSTYTGTAMSSLGYYWQGSTGATQTAFGDNVTVVVATVSGPEINIQGNSTTIVDGDVTPTTTDHSDFSSACVNGGAVVRTFTIQNTGIANLTVSSIALSGTNAADFTLGGTTSGIIAASSSSTFTVTFDPSASGTRSATVTVNNDDTDEGVYDFAIQGTGTAPTISTSAISGSPFCISASVSTIVSVPFTSNCATFGGANVFTAQLSSSTGSFAAPVSLGTLTSTATSGTISGTIPVTVTTTGTGYRIRVVASAESSVGALNGADNGSNLTINVGPVNATSPGATVASGQTVLTWTNAACYDKVLVVGNIGSVTATPTGDGSAYSGSLTFGSGTALLAGQYAIYKNTSNNITVTGLTNGTTYCFKIFTLKGTTWSSGVEVCVTPSISYCTTGGNLSFETSINNVTINTINNTTTNPKAAAYTNTGISTTLDRGSSYTLSITGNTDGNYTCYIMAWVDWNYDGDFSDSGEEYNLGDINNTAAGVLTTTVTVPYSVPLLGLRMRTAIRYFQNPGACDAAGYDGEVEDYVLTIQNGCTSAAAITSFGPISGPVGTIVNIVGTGFTGASAVSVNGANVTSFTVVSATQITAEIAASNTLGPIMVTVGGCPAVSSSTFTLLTQSGTCGTGAISDLIISEIHDPTSGNNHYIEIFNGTGASVNMANYKLRVINLSPGPTTTTYTLTGTIANNTTEVFWAGANGTLDNNQSTSLSGFNELDEIRLLNAASTTIDIVVCPNETGYTFIRKSTITAPNSTYTASEWNFSSTPSTSNIGSHSFTSGVVPANVTSQPTDQTGEQCAATVFTNTSTGTTLTYQWYVNDGSATTWSTTSAGVYSGSTTASLTVDPVIGLNGYQYYCLVTTSGTCNVFTNAAQLTETSNTKTYFRSAGSGNWTTVGTWQIATSTAGPWSTACIYPVYNNSDYISIQNGHTVDIANDLTLDQVIVQTGGTLTLSINNTVTLNNGTGVDWDILGTYIENSSSGNGLSFNASATWSLGTAGTIVKTNNSSVVKFRDNFSGGISTIPATGYWIYRYVGNLVAVAAIDMFYPNLTLESNSGFYDFTNAVSKFSGSSGFATVKGNMDVGGSGSGTVKSYNINTNASHMLIIGNLTVQSGSTLTNYDATTYGTGFELRGNLTVTGTLICETIGNFKFSGGNIQTVSGTGTFTVYNGTVNKSSNYITLSRDIDFKTGLTLTAGVIQTNSNRIILSNTTAANLTHSTGSASFIYGTLRRHITINTSTYEFPIGDGLNTTNYKRADLINNSLNGITYIEGFVNTVTEIAPNDDPTFVTAAQTQDQNGTGIATPLEFIMEAAQWDLTPNTTTFTGDYGVKLYTANTGLSGSDDNTFCPVKRPSGSATYANWVSLSTSTTIPALGAAGRIYNSGNGYAQRLGYTAFSKHAIAKGGGILPVELLSFNAKKKNSDVELTWSTASEINSSKFLIERGNNDESFSTILAINAAGYSTSVRNYINYDFNPNIGKNYYRLKQVDFDGKFMYSDIKMVDFDETIKTNSAIYKTNESQLRIETNLVDKNAAITIYDSAGRLILNGTITLNYGNANVPFNPGAEGIYFVKVVTEHDIITAKIIY